MYILSAASAGHRTRQAACTRCKHPICPDCKECEANDRKLLALENVYAESDEGGDGWCATIEEMVETNADTLEGIRAKARIACALRLGDLDEVVFYTSGREDSERNGREQVKCVTLENSILRDLIRLYDPHLERKGAVQALLVECTTGYANKEIDNDERS
jgi:hypothetical protein